MARGVECRDQATVLRLSPDECVGFKTDDPRFSSLQPERLPIGYVQQDYRPCPEAVGFESAEIQNGALWENGLIGVMRK